MDVTKLQVIRHYHGHLSGVYSLALHPTLDLLMTGGRDSVCRVWDMRSKVQAHVLTGHDDTVCSILSQPTDPQVSLLRMSKVCSLAGQQILIGRADIFCSVLSHCTVQQCRMLNPRWTGR